MGVSLTCLGSKRLNKLPKLGPTRAPCGHGCPEVLVVDALLKTGVREDVFSKHIRSAPGWLTQSTNKSTNQSCVYAPDGCAASEHCADVFKLQS